MTGENTGWGKSKMWYKHIIEYMLLSERWASKMATWIDLMNVRLSGKRKTQNGTCSPMSVM